MIGNKCLYIILIRAYTGGLHSFR